MTAWLILVGIGTLSGIWLLFYAHAKKPSTDVPSAPPEPEKPPEKPSVPITTPVTPKPPMTQAELVYRNARDLMGRHLTLNAAVPDELGCCEALSVVLKRAGYAIPPLGIEGVNAMIAWMLGKGFSEVNAPTPGDIITAHSPAYYEQHGAHVGVVMVNGICSNTSANGLWQENYTSVAAWRRAYPQSTVRFFRPL